MNKTLPLWGMFAASMACAQAPSGVTLYGVVDTGVEYVTHVGGAATRQWRMPTNTASVPSRWGLRGSEDLGGGLRAVFTLESGFAPDTGTFNQGGRAWGRQAFVGMAGAWGILSFGRQYTMLFWSLSDADVLGPNIYGLPSLDSYVPNARADNSLAYRGTFSELTLGAAYSLGRDAVNAASPAGTNCAGESATDKKACREWSLLLKYDAPTWGTAVTIDRQYGGPGAFTGLTSSSMRDTRAMVNGYYKFSDGKVGAGLMRRSNGGSPVPKSDILFIGASYNIAPLWTLDAEVFRLDFKNSANQATLFAVRGTYYLSKRTAAYATLGQMSNAGTLAVSVSGGGPGVAPAPGANQSGTMLGLRHTF